METIGWLATLAVVTITTFIVGYWFGYRCGFDDARDGISER